MKKKILACLLMLVMASSGVVHAQLYHASQKSAILTYNYDLASTSFIYCTYWGKNNDPWGVAGGMAAQAPAKTTGSSTTIDAVTAGQSPFLLVAVGDLLVFRSGTTTNLRRVTARASADQITVDTSIDLGTTGVFFEFYTQKCGTTASDGWMDVTLFSNLTFVRQISTFNATSIDSQVECRHNAIPAAAVIIDTKNATATGVYAVSIYQGAWDACRLGLKINTDTGAQSISVSAAYNR